MHDAILSAMDNGINLRVEMAVRSTPGSSGNGPSNTVHNPDQKDFIEDTENTPPIPASSRLDLIMEQDKIDETRNIENVEDGDIPAVRPSSDRRAPIHHMMTVHNVPHSSIPVFFSGRNPSQNSPMPQQFPQPQNMVTHIPPANEISMVEQTPQRHNSDSKDSVNKLAEAIAGIASQH